jgi:hypothetical protein
VSWEPFGADGPAPHRGRTARLSTRADPPARRPDRTIRLQADGPLLVEISFDIPAGGDSGVAPDIDVIDLAVVDP